MATTSQLLAEYVKRTAGQVSSSLKEAEEQRMGAIKDIIREEKARSNVAEDIKPSEILRELTARDKLQGFVQAENEMKKYGITDKTVQQYQKEEEERRKSSLKGLEERFERERKAKEADVKRKAEVAEELVNQTDAVNSVADGSSPTMNYAFKKAPARISNTYRFSDINIISATEAEPDFEKTEAYFTEKDIKHMYDNGTFENAGITEEKVRKYLNIDIETGAPVNGIMPVKGAQELMYEYLQTPESSNLRTAYKIEMKDPKQQEAFEQFMGFYQQALGRDDISSAPSESTRVQGANLFEFPQG